MGPCHAHLERILGAEQHGKLAEVLRGLLAHDERHEAAPEERHRDADGHLIQPDVSLLRSGMSRLLSDGACPTYGPSNKQAALQVSA